MEAPEICGEVHAASTDASSVHDCWLCDRLVLRSRAKGGRLFSEVVGQKMLIKDLQLIGRENVFPKVGALLQPHDAKSFRRKFFGKDPSSRARTDDHEIDFVGRLITHPR